jgi:D-alanyl-D-alanine carboxypeptidase
VAVHSVGTSVVGAQTPITATDHLRLASVSKAFSGAVALSLVARHVLRLSDTVGKWLPSLPAAWHRVTLAQLLQHTSGIPDFSGSTEFIDDLLASPLDPPAPEALLAYAAPELTFPPGTEFEYSNSDNIIAALMVEAATHRTYEEELQALVFAPIGLHQTSLPSGAALPTPYAHGYAVSATAPPIDYTNFFAAGWSWSAGGIVSTPADTDRFIRAYARGAVTDAATHEAQFRFRPGSSEPPGPGVNSAGLAIFRYQTRCGTVYGHTGNTLGYTQFAASTADGSRSVVVQINAQLSPRTDPAGFAALQNIYTLGVCAALGR